MQPQSQINQLIQRCKKKGYFADREIFIEAQIDSGTVNQCWKLRSGNHYFLARISRELPEQFLTNWIAEIKLNQIAADIGVAVEPLWLDSDSLSAIYPWAGKPLSKDDLSADLLSALGDTLSHLHNKESSAKKISYRHTIENYLNIIQPKERPEELLMLADQWDQDSALVFCHHDLNPGNILWDGDKLTLIDWEYARTAHPLFDLASLSYHYDLTDQDLETLLSNYSPTRYGLEEIQSSEKIVRGLERLWFEAAVFEQLV